MAEETQEKQYSTEELVAIANDALMKNRQLQGMVNDLADKVKSREIENSSLRTTLGMIQGQQAGGEDAEASTAAEDILLGGKRGLRMRNCGMKQLMVTSME